jgi:predicted oxidoreductase
VRPDGSPIRQLYSAGELGSIYSYLYQETGDIGECLAFGRISGRNAAAEVPWT